MCQFNIGNMNLSSNTSHKNLNIFNKRTVDPEKVYNKILNNEPVKGQDIEDLDYITSGFKPKNKEELKKIIKFYSDKYPNNSLNWLNVSEITDMSYLFYGSKYNGDISKWNVSNVETMAGMFAYSKFNKCISEWDVSNVETMAGMFAYSKFNYNINEWKVSKETNMTGMFAGSQFDQDISKWNVSNETKEQMWGKI